MTGPQIAAHHSWLTQPAFLSRERRERARPAGQELDRAAGWSGSLPVEREWWERFTLQVTVAPTSAEHLQQVAPHERFPSLSTSCTPKPWQGEMTVRPILQQKKMRPGKEKQLAQGRTARERQHPEPRGQPGPFLSSPLTSSICVLSGFPISKVWEVLGFSAVETWCLRFLFSSFLWIV